MKKGFIITALLFSLTSISQAATLYVGDNLRVGVRSESNNQSAPFEVITSGAKVELLKKKAGYSYVRTADGKKGWVRSLYLSETPPAKALLPELQHQYAKTLQEQEQLRQKLKNTYSEKEKLSNNLKSLNKDLKRLNSTLTDLTSESNNTVLYLTTTFLALFTLAFTLGILWHKQQVAKKLGGQSL